MAARRELKEETGYEADELKFLARHPLSLGTSSGYVYYYFAKCSKKGERKPEPSELIDRVEEVPSYQFEKMIQNGEYVQREGMLIWMMLQREKR